MTGLGEDGRRGMIEGSGDEGGLCRWVKGEKRREAERGGRKGGGHQRGQKRMVYRRGRRKVRAEWRRWRVGGRERKMWRAG
jgi:hypothetical protein